MSRDLADKPFCAEEDTPLFGPGDCDGFSFSEYQKACAKTAIYPGRGELYGLLYAVLGLSGEAGEVANKVKKILRDAKTVEEVRAALTDELGDVLWYAARLASELNTSLSEVARRNIEKLQSRAARGKVTGDGDNR